MEYDYGAGWEFEMELLSITEMKRGAGTHYPYVTDGKGKGIIENISPYELLEAIEHTDQTGEVPLAVEIFTGKKREWDYIDSHVKYFDNMYVKRLRTYKRTGFTLLTGEINARQVINAIYDSGNYSEKCERDMVEADKNIIISSPDIRQDKIEKLLYLIKSRQEG